jgi:hypothetical protein
MRVKNILSAALWRLVNPLRRGMSIGYTRSKRYIVSSILIWGLCCGGQSGLAAMSEEWESPP